MTRFDSRNLLGMFQVALHDKILVLLLIVPKADSTRSKLPDGTWVVTGEEELKLGGLLKGWNWGVYEAPTVKLFSVIRKFFSRI